MAVLKRISNWLSKHWTVIWQRPVNGQNAVKDIEPILKEMCANNKRVSVAVQKLQDDTSNVQRMMADGSISRDNRT